MKKYVYFIRHAESQANVSEKNVIGSHNIPVELTEKGQEQATALGEYFKSIGISFTKAYSSTAVRTQRTAEYCFKAMGCSLSLQTTDLLLEQCSGGWAGKSREIYNRADVRYALDTDNWNYVLGDDEPGESQSMVANRMANWIEEVVKPNEPSEQDEHIVVFTHGNALKYLYALLLDKDKPTAFKKPIDNASISLYAFENGQLLTMQDSLQQTVLEIDNFTVAKINDKVQMHSALRQLSLFGRQDKTRAPKAEQQNVSYLNP